MTIFADYTYQDKPEVKDADGNSVHLNSFNVARSYINVTGNINHYIAFRVTPDITRETGAGSSLNGSYTFRLKYAFAQFNLDDYMTHGLVGALRPAADALRRLRGRHLPLPLPGHDLRGARGLPVLVRRRRVVPLQPARRTTATSTPASTTARTTTSRKSTTRRLIQIRGTVRPLPSSAVLRGLRFTGFYDHDAYVKNADEAPRASSRRRSSTPTSTPSFEYLATKDQTSATKIGARRQGLVGLGEPEVAARAGRRSLRFDHFEPDDNTEPEARAPDRRRLLLVPAPGQRLDGAAVRLDNATFNELHAGAADAAKIARARAGEFLTRNARRRRDAMTLWRRST